MALSPEFTRMKERSGEALEYMRGRLRFDLGKHQKTKLKVLGELKDRTLLTKSVAEKHATNLEKQFYGRWRNLTKKEMNERLRFITVLAELAPLDLDATAKAVERMFSKLRIVFGSIRGIEVIGAAEIEIVNVEKMKRMASVADEARKLDVIDAMLPAEEKSLYKTGITSYALVHFHGVIDVGNSGAEKLRKLDMVSRHYWSEKYAVQIKSLYSTKTVKKNLTDIATYLTKGGNENLIYKIGFGYDDEDKIQRQLLKAGRAKKEGDYAGIENELSLTIAEVKFLGEAINQMMDRTCSKNMRNGYLFKYGQQQKWVR
jgi:hypothetical protein